MHTILQLKVKSCKHGLQFVTVNMTRLDQKTCIGIVEIGMFIIFL